MKRIDASGHVSNKWSEGNPSTGVLATKFSSDFANILQEELAHVVEYAGLALDQAHNFEDPTTPHDTTQIRQAIQAIAASSGGGGGGGFRWTPVSGEAPVEAEENLELVYLFGQGLAQKLVAFVKIPTAYQAGNQIKMNVSLYSPAATGTVLFQTVSTLVRAGVDAISSTTNQRTSTNVAITNSVAEQLRVVELDLTDASGAVNGVPVSAGDLLKIELSRQTDLDTSEVRVIPNATEVRFA